MTPEKEVIFVALNHYLAVATLVGFVIVVLWAIDLIGTHFNIWKGFSSRYSWVVRYAIPLGFFATLIAMLTSLYYSDYLGILPCGLCWFQRIFIYSQVFILGYAWLKKDGGVWGYSIVLSTVGLVVALYQEYLQLGYSELLPCPAIASTIDCAKPTFIEYGFITFPFMAVVIFLFLILLAVTVCRNKR